RKRRSCAATVTALAQTRRGSCRRDRIEWRAAISCDGSRRLRHGPPELRVVTEEDACAGFFQRLQPVERGQHRLSIVHIARKATLAQRLAEIAGVCREHDLPAVEPQPQ